MMRATFARRAARAPRTALMALLPLPLLLAARPAVAPHGVALAYLGGPPPNYTIAARGLLGDTNPPQLASRRGGARSRAGDGVAASPRAVRDVPPERRPALPLVEVRAPRAARDLLAVVITGDGGWAAADKGIAAALTGRGVDVVGLDARQYLQRPRTPDDAGADLEQMLRYYLPAWGRERVILVGYSRGAELAPFMVNRLPPDLRRRVALVAMLGPSEMANFQFHWTDLLLNKSRTTDIPVRPEIERLRGTPMLCVYGRTDARALCPSLDSTLARVVEREGGHHVHKDEGSEIADWILEAVGPE